VHPELLQRQRLPPDTTKEDIWKHRFRAINEWERTLVENGVRIVKVWLNISKDEQRRRLLARIDDPDRNWKFSAVDIAERAHWSAYQQAYAEMIAKTSTEYAPWHVVPADHKWFARVAVAAALVDALADINPKFPKVDDAGAHALQEARAQLESEPD
jgi:polyphosphate kinase 2 (PPK2 family)